MEKLEMTFAGTRLALGAERQPIKLIDRVSTTY
jgi:hypothetical protein